jgi:4-hydroxybenzoate polyprenyltransferase
MQQKLINYFLLMRLHKPVGILLLLLPCLFGMALFSAKLDWDSIWLFTLGAVAMRSGGCIINDIADRRIDAKVSRTKNRPLASGAVTTLEAFILLILLLIIGLYVAISLGEKIVLLGLLWLPLIMAYPFMKRITWWPQVFLGITFGAGGLFAQMAVDGIINTQGLLLYIACIFWVIGYDTIYAVQDMAEDAKIGVKSSAIAFGGQLKIAVSTCYLIFISLIGFCFYLNELKLPSYMLLFLSSLILIWQIKSLNLTTPQNCAKLFNSNVYVGILILIGLLF